MAREMQMHLREMPVGVGLGLAVNEWWLRRSLRSFSDSIERSDFDEAERGLRSAHLTRLDVFLRRPPNDPAAEQ